MLQKIEVYDKKLKYMTKIEVSDKKLKHGTSREPCFETPLAPS